MTLLKTYGIGCNGCSAFIPSTWSTSTAARGIARKRGWSRIPGSTRAGADYCPACTTRRAS